MSQRQADPNYDFGGYDDEYRGFELRDEDSGRGPLILLLALGVLLIFAGVVWNTYRQGVRPADGALPIIGAEEAPYKRAPDERGGTQVAGQDVGFYDLMEPETEDTLPRKAAMTNPVPLRRGGDELAGAADEIPALPEAPKSGPVVLGVAPTKLAEGLDVRDVPAVPEQPVQTAALGPVSLLKKPEPEAPIIAELPKPEPVVSRFSAGGAYQVQLLASRSENNAAAAWAQIKSDNQRLYSGAHLDVQKADLGAKGIFYRVRVGAFETRENAKSFCEDVKKSGNDCMVVARTF